jgi:hypothetical protein
MGKHSEIFRSSPYRNQLRSSLKEKQRKTGNLTAEVTRTEKSTVKNASKSTNSVNILLEYIFTTHEDKIARSSHLSRIKLLVVFLSFCDSRY